MAWKIDSAHSHIQFSVRHMMIATVRGSFTQFGGEVDFNEDDPAASSLDVTIDAASINTGEEDRDNHLRSEDFLHVEKYPNITFRSTRVERVDDNHGKIYGDLTIKETTNEVVLDTEFVGKAKSPWGTTSAGFSASTTLNRKNWGLTWNQTLETGGVLVGDKMNVDIEVELVHEPEEQAEPETAAAG